MLYIDNLRFASGEKVHTTLSLTVITTVGYTTNVSVNDLQGPASTRCSSECISLHSELLKKLKKRQQTNGRSIGLYVTAAERNPSELSFSCLLMSFEELI